MQNVQQLQSSIESEQESRIRSLQTEQAAQPSIHLDIAPMVQRTDISQMNDEQENGAHDEVSDDSAENALPRSSETGSKSPVAFNAEPKRNSRPRRSSIFQQTATGIKAMYQLATGANQVAPALFEEVRERTLLCAAMLPFPGCFTCLRAITGTCDLNSRHEVRSDMCAEYVVSCIPQPNAKCS